MSNKYITDLLHSRLAYFCLNYVWKERCLWGKTLGSALLVTLVVYISTPREYEAELFTFAESTVPEINDTRSIDAMTYNIRRPVRDDIIPSYYNLLFRSRPFLMSVLQSPVVKQDALNDTITLYEYITQDIRYPWWTYLRSGIMKVAGWPIKLVRSWGETNKTLEEDTLHVPNLDRYPVGYTGINRLTRRENVATGVLWKRISYEVDVSKRAVIFRLRMQDPLVAAIAVDSLKRRVEERVNESRMAKIRQNLAYLEEEVEKARTEYEKVQKTYADYWDRNQDLSTRRARMDLFNLNIDRQLAYTTYRQRMMQRNRAQENLYRKYPVLTVVHPAEVPQHPVAPWAILGWCLLGAVIGTISWIFLKKHAFKLYFKKLKRPTISRPRLFRKRLSL